MNGTSLPSYYAEQCSLGKKNSVDPTVKVAIVSELLNVNADSSEYFA